MIDIIIPILQIKLLNAHYHPVRILHSQGLNSDLTDTKSLGHRKPSRLLNKFKTSTALLESFSLSYVLNYIWDLHDWALSSVNFVLFGRSFLP